MPATMTANARHAGKRGDYDTHEEATHAMHRWCERNGASAANVRVYPCDQGGDRHFHFGHSGKPRRGGRSTMKRW